MSAAQVPSNLYFAPYPPITPFSIDFFRGRLIIPLRVSQISHTATLTHAQEHKPDHIIKLFMLKQN